MRDDQKIRAEFDRDALKRVCEMHEREFGDHYDMTRVKIADVSGPEDYYYFLDRGASVLAVAHLDTVVGHKQRTATFIDTEAGEVVHSGALDDRLGAYIILELLPRLGIDVDVLLTVGEESGQSTAEFFAPDKSYDWMIEFDRGGTDVVMYQYDDDNTRAAVREVGARVGDGSFSDIAFLEHLGIKGYNWGVGYQDYHSVRGHAYLDDTFMMVEYFVEFHRQNDGVFMPHEQSDPWYTKRSSSSSIWDDEELEAETFDEDGMYFDRDYIDYPTPEDLRRAATWVD